jgi:hypothetical protein
MVINLGPELEAVLVEQAQRQGVTPEALALQTLHERFIGRRPVIEPRDEWERRLFSAATDCGVSLSHEALSSEGLYE